MRAPWTDGFPSDPLDCPEVVANGVTYPGLFERQLPTLQPAGLVVLSAGNVPTTIPWGAHVTMTVDTLTRPSNSTSFGCGTDPAKVLFANVLSVTR